MEKIINQIKDKYKAVKIKSTKTFHRSLTGLGDFLHIPKWVRRELVIFGTMFWEAGKFILVAVVSFGIVYGIINAPAVQLNIKYWYFANYKDEAKDSASYWNIKLPTSPNAQMRGDYIIIPKIGVYAPIVYVPSDDEKTVFEGLKNGVVHYPGTANPGQRGSVFITGHSSYYWWSNGKYNTVFALLDKLVIGDLVYITYTNKLYTYQISDFKIVSPSDLSVLNQTTEPTLTLMTCTPLGTSFKRLIFKARQISPRIR